MHTHIHTHTRVHKYTQAHIVYNKTELLKKTIDQRLRARQFLFCEVIRNRQKKKTKKNKDKKNYEKKKNMM